MRRQRNRECCCVSDNEGVLSVPNSEGVLSVSDSSGLKPEQLAHLVCKVVPEVMQPEFTALKQLIAAQASSRD